MRKKFLTYILASLAIGLTLSTVYYYAVCDGLRHTREFFPGRLNVILYDTTRYEAVFVGTSRASKNIDPLIFDSCTGLHSYNAGLEGSSYTVIDMMTRKFVRNHHPRYVFINLDIYTLEKENSLYDFPQYFPHMDDRDIASLAARKPELNAGRYAPFIAISYIDDYLKGAALNEQIGFYPDDDLSFAHRGFSPNVDSVFSGEAGAYSLRFLYDTANFKKLDELCRYCRDQNCQVVFIMAPIYASFADEGKKTKDFDDRLKQIVKTHDISVFDHYADRRFTKGMFSNRTHLNRRGADLYSYILAMDFLSRAVSDSLRSAGKYGNTIF